MLQEIYEQKEERDISYQFLSGITRLAETALCSCKGSQSSDLYPSLLLCSVHAFVIVIRVVSIFAISAIFTIFVIIVIFVIFIEFIIDFSFVSIQIVIVFGANGIFPVTISLTVGFEVGMHVTVVIDITPAWFFLWKLNVSCSLLTFVDPLISSVYAVFEHALLSQADNLRELVSLSEITETFWLFFIWLWFWIEFIVSVLGSFSPMSISNVVLVAVGIELSGTFSTLFVQTKFFKISL